MAEAATRVTAGYLLVTTSLVLYVYRFAVGGVNLSAFRLVLLGWIAWYGVDLVRGRVPLRHYLPFIVVAAGILVINVVDFLTLSGYPALRRDIANHLLNVAFAGLVAASARDVVRRARLLHAFVLSSVVTTAIGAYAAVEHRLPFESMIRTLGSSDARGLSYINDDTVFVRATSSFFDPNFYGIYSMLVVLAILYLWRFDRPARYLAVLLPVNLVCLGLTLSRTATLGLLAGLGVAFLLDRRGRLMTTAVAVSAVVLLYGSATVQSYQGAAALRAQLASTWQQITSSASERSREEPARTALRSPPADRAADGSGAPAGTRRPDAPTRADTRRVPQTAESVGAGSRAVETASVDVDLVQDRVANARSLSNRVAYIRHGLGVFAASPWWGQGSAALVGLSQWSSAHVSYLTLLARYGILGTLVYLAFLIWPLVVVWRGGAARRGAPADRYLVTVPLAALCVVYLSYDILLFFEVQYLVFGLAWATTLTGPARVPHEAAL